MSGFMQMRWCLVLFVLLGTLGCRSRNLDAVGEPGTPLVILLGPTHAASPDVLATLTEYLTSQTGLAIEVRVARDEAAAMNLAGTYQIDAGILPLFDYLFCHQEYRVEAGLQVLRQEGSRTYTGEIFVRADSDIHRPEDLEGKRVAFVSGYSTSGFLYPAALLRDAGVTPVCVFTGSHQSALTELREGRVDAAATFTEAVEGDPHFRSIGTTQEIPNEPVFFRAGLSPQLRQSISQALLQFAATEEGPPVLLHMAGITGFAPVSDEDYLEVHERISTVGIQVEDLVPDGWRIRNLNRLRPADLAP